MYTLLECAAHARRVRVLRGSRQNPDRTRFIAMGRGRLGARILTRVLFDAKNRSHTSSGVYVYRNDVVRRRADGPLLRRSERVVIEDTTNRFTR